MDLDRKKLIREYKTTPRPAGVFLVRNVAERRSFVGSATDLSGILNRHRFQLENGLHPNRRLQADWNAFGETAFAFEVLDRLQPEDDLARDPREDLSVLRAIWTEKLIASGESLYEP